MTLPNECVTPLSERDLMESEQFAAGCDLAPNAGIRIKKLAAAYRQLSIARDAIVEELKSADKALEPLGGNLLESRERKIARAAMMAADVEKLVGYACTVRRNSVLGGDPFVVVDVDGIVISTGPNVAAAMHYAIYKIETGEDVPDQEQSLLAELSKEPTHD